MDAVIEFKLPELGENIEQGDLVRLMISPGASVSRGQAVMELETDKAVVEVPSSVSGTVQELRVKECEKIKVGQVMFTVENGTGAKAAAEPSSEKKAVAPSRAETGVPQNQQDRGQQDRPVSSAREGGPSTATKAPAAAATAATTAPEKQAHEQPTGPAAKTPSAGSGASEFKLPELGENISQGDLVRLMIGPGSKVSEGQPVMELETDKAVVEVPSSVSGGVKEGKGKEGEKVRVGQFMFTLEGGVPSQPEPSRPRNAPVEHVSGQHGARLAFQAAIRAEGKTEEQALPPDQPRETVPAFTMPVQLGKVAGTEHRQPIPSAPHVRRRARG